MQRKFPALSTAVLVSLMVSCFTLESAPLMVPACAKALPDYSAGWKVNLAEGERLMKTREYARAELCFRKAWDDVKLAVPHSADDEVLCMLNLARVMYKQDLIADTVPLYKKIIHKLEKAHGKSCSNLIDPLIDLAGIYEDEGDYKKSAQHYTRAIDITARASGVQSLAYADYEHRLGRVRVAQESLKEGEELYLISMDNLMHQSKLPSSDLLNEVLADYIQLLLKTEGRAKILHSAFQGELLQDRVGSLKKKRGTPESNFSAEVSVQLRSNLGSETTSPPATSTAGSTVPDAVAITPDKGFSDFAALEKINQQRIAFYERMIATDIDSLGAEHPSVARDLSGLASLYIQQRKYDEAKPLLQRALTIYRNAYKDNSAPVRQTEFLLQLISEEQSPNAAAIDVSYIKSLPKIPMEAQSLEVALRLNDLAFMLYCQGKIDAAMKVYYWALASTTGSTGENSLLSAASMADLSRVLRLRGRGDEARKLEGNAQAIVRRDLIEKRTRLLP